MHGHRGLLHFISRAAVRGKRNGMDGKDAGYPSFKRCRQGKKHDFFGPGRANVYHAFGFVIRSPFPHVEEVRSEVIRRSVFWKQGANGVELLSLHLVNRAIGTVAGGAALEIVRPLRI